MSSGQPSVECGHSPDENHVSSTSSSWAMRSEAHPSHALGVSNAAVRWAQSAQCHTGMRCPHHNWRLMHQSRMFSSQSRYTLAKRSGTMRIAPLVTASLARCASGPARTNHCVLTSGSTTTPERCEWPTAWTCGSLRSSSPSRSNCSTMAARASKRS